MLLQVLINFLQHVVALKINKLLWGRKNRIKKQASVILKDENMNICLCDLLLQTEILYLTWKKPVV